MLFADNLRKFGSRSRQAFDENPILSNTLWGPTRGTQLSYVQICEIINVCCLSLYVCGNFLCSIENEYKISTRPKFHKVILLSSLYFFSDEMEILRGRTIFPKSYTKQMIELEFPFIYS